LTNGARLAGAMSPPPLTFGAAMFGARLTLPLLPGVMVFAACFLKYRPLRLYYVRYLKN
jgi:hypothetical protein